MGKEPQISDIWIINYSVPYKDKNNLQRPFIVTNIIKDTIYGVPLTSFRTSRYKPNLGDITFRPNFLQGKSIIKPYQLISIKNIFFIKKIGVVDQTIVNYVNQKIDKNVHQYLSMKNISSIMREYVIERQNQKIENLFQEITKVKNELSISQKQLSLINLDKELLLLTANKIINELQQKLEFLQKQLIITK